MLNKLLSIHLCVCVFAIKVFCCYRTIIYNSVRTFLKIEIYLQRIIQSSNPVSLSLYKTPPLIKLKYLYKDTPFLYRVSCTISRMSFSINLLPSLLSF